MPLNIHTLLPLLYKVMVMEKWCCVVHDLFLHHQLNLDTDSLTGFCGLLYFCRLLHLLYHRQIGDGCFVIDWYNTVLTYQSATPGHSVLCGRTGRSGRCLFTHSHTLIRPFQNRSHHLYAFVHDIQFVPYFFHSIIIFVRMSHGMTPSVSKKRMTTQVSNGALF